MTATERLRQMVEGKPVSEIGASGWLHSPGADRDVRKCFPLKSSA